MGWARGLGALALAAAWSAALVAPLAAETKTACIPEEAPAGVLGVSRTVEIDTSGGPWLGAPHGAPDLLRPGEVVLTFDDGPVPASTRAILAALAAECTKATFFMVGQMAAAHPELVREVVAAGHTVGTHTWSHPNLALMAPARMKGQIEMAIAAVQKAADAPIAPFFRYPYLSSTGASVAYLRARNIAQVAIDVDSFDYLVRTPQIMVRRTMTRLAAKRRGIILMHDIHASTARAVPELLARLKAGGYKIVHLQPKAPVETLEVAEASALMKPPEGKRQPRRRVKATAQHVEAPAPDSGAMLDWLWK